jgi:hypothetical protein
MPCRKKRDKSFVKSSELCRGCGLCCCGLFFFHDNFPDEYGLTFDAPAQNSDLKFPLCCPLSSANGCLIHNDPRRPYICQDYQCQLLKKYMHDEITLEFGRRLIAELIRLFRAIKDRVPLDRSRPAFELIDGIWGSQQKSKTPSIRLDTAQVLDVASLIRLVRHYILPFQGGFIASCASRRVLAEKNSK